MSAITRLPETVLYSVLGEYFDLAAEDERRQNVEYGETLNLARVSRQWITPSRRAAFESLRIGRGFPKSMNRLSDFLTAHPECFGYVRDVDATGYDESPQLTALVRELARRADAIRYLAIDGPSRFDMQIYTSFGRQPLTYLALNEMDDVEKVRAALRTITAGRARTSLRTIAFDLMVESGGRDVLAGLDGRELPELRGMSFRSEWPEQAEVPMMICQAPKCTFLDIDSSSIAFFLSAVPFIACTRIDRIDLSFIQSRSRNGLHTLEMAEKRTLSSFGGLQTINMDLSSTQVHPDFLPTLPISIKSVTIAVEEYEDVADGMKAWLTPKYRVKHLEKLNMIVYNGEDVDPLLEKTCTRRGVDLQWVEDGADLV